MFFARKGMKLFNTVKGILENMIWPQGDEFIGVKINSIGDFVVSWKSALSKPDEITTLLFPICTLIVQYKTKNFGEFINYLRSKIARAEPGQMNVPVSKEGE